MTPIGIIADDCAPHEPLLSILAIDSASFSGTRWAFASYLTAVSPTAGRGCVAQFAVIPGSLLKDTGEQAAPSGWFRPRRFRLGVGQHRLL